MSIECNREDLRWYVIRTHPNQEERAAGNIRAMNVEAFAPRRRKVIYNPYNGKPTSLSRPLFPRYVFARFGLEEALHKIRFTRGVHSLVCFDANPAEVDDEIVRLMQARVAKDGFVRLSDEFEPGEEVVISEGPFRNFRGIFERQMGDEDRVRILLDAVSYQAHVIVEKHMVKKAGAGAAQRASL
ncbi:MAG: transcription termination/antitermination protein NusG [Blastocatellia bacterium]